MLAALVDGPRTVTEVAGATRLSKATAYRILASLGHRSLVIKDETASIYMIGPGILQFLNGAARAFDSIGPIATEGLRRLKELTGETAVVHVRLGLNRLCLAQVESSHDVRYTVQVGSLSPLHVGSTGKILLAFAANSERDDLVRNLRLERVTDRTVTDRQDLLEQLRVVRDQGYAFSVGERTPGASGLSVPIEGPDGFLAALSVIGPSDRLAPDRIDLFLPDLRRVAVEIRMRLGNGGGWDGLKASKTTPKGR